MISTQNNVTRLANTPPMAVVPFFVYGSISFMVACLLAFFSTDALLRHYLNPEIISLTHFLAIAWATMIIFGAAHQLLPVLIESSIYSIKLVYIVFVISAVSLPFLLFSFYKFQMGFIARISAFLMLLAFIIFLINVSLSIYKSKTENIHAIFVFTSAIWLLITGISGFLQVYNLTSVLLQNNSFYYLPFHAAAGIGGWFLLLVIGIASRLIPMFLISKYSNKNLLWAIYILINTGLGLFIYLFLNSFSKILYHIPITLITIAILLFIFYCYNSYKDRIRRIVEPQLKISLVSVISTFVPLLIIAVIIGSSANNNFNVKLISLYGFIIFFICISMLIMGMTFKTLPFIIWNKIYGKTAGKHETPSPKELYSSRIFNIMVIVYGIAVVIFASGILLSHEISIKAGAALMFISSVLYNFNVFKVIFHKASFK